MTRERMIEMLLMSNFNGSGSPEQIAAYRKHLEAKTDLQLENMVMINF